MINYKKKYNVLHFLNSGYIGGQEKSIYQLVKAFENDEEFNFGLAVSFNKGLYVSKVKELKIPVIYLGLNSGYSLKLDKAIINKLKGYHIHHFHNPMINTIILSLFSGFKIKRVLTRRGGVHNYWHEYGMKVGVKHFIAKILIKNFFDGFSGNTHHSAEFLSHSLGLKNNKTYCLYNGFDFSQFEPNSKKKDILNELDIAEWEFKIGTACHLIDLKRVDLIIRAFSLCNIDKKKLIIFGKGNRLENLQQLVGSLGLYNKVIFAGEVKNMPDYMQILNCFILASGREESFGNSVVEAMYLKIPSIIMHDGMGLREHIVHNRTGFVAKDEVDLADKIEYIFRNQEKANKIAEDASDYVFKKYSLNNMIDTYKRFYRYILIHNKNSFIEDQLSI